MMHLSLSDDVKPEMTVTFSAVANLRFFFFRVLSHVFLTFRSSQQFCCESLNVILFQLLQTSAILNYFHFFYDISSISKIFKNSFL